jgi:hypothetical protein
MWASPGPISDDWPIPKGGGVAFLVRYLIAQQTQEYGTNILGKPFTHAVLTRNMKLLCAEFDDETLKRAIALGCLKSDHPFSTKFVKAMAEWLQVLRDSPTQRFYRSKS